MAEKMSAQRKMAWAAAVRAEEAAGVVFDRLGQTIQEALDVKNQAITLVPDQAEMLEAEWDRLLTLVQAAIYTHSHLPHVPDHTHPDYAQASSFRDLRVEYGDAKWQAIGLERELTQFAVRCETLSFSPVGLREWLSQLQDKYAQLARLSMNMIRDRIITSPLAEVDELSMLLQEAERFGLEDRSNRMVDVLEDARRIAESVERQLAAQLNLDDFKLIDLDTVTRQANWAERNIAAARQTLEGLMDAHGFDAVQDVAQGVSDTTERLVEARETIIAMAGLLEDPDQDDSNARYGLSSVLQLCWEIDELCVAVDRRQRELG